MRAVKREMGLQMIWSSVKIAYLFKRCVLTNRIELELHCNLRSVLVHLNSCENFGKWLWSLLSCSVGCEYIHTEQRGIGIMCACICVASAGS